MLRLWIRLTLLQRFTIASAAIAVGLAVLLSAVTVEAIQGFAVKDEAQVAAEVVLRAFAPQIRPGDFQGALPPERHALLDALFLAHGISDKILRVRLWRADGQLLYSNKPEPADVGAAPADLSSPDSYRRLVLTRQVAEAGSSQVARFIVPVQLAGNPRPLGAFEIFYDLTLLQQRLTYIRRAIWTAVPMGLFMLYASVFVLVRRASRQLLQQQGDLIAAHLGTYQALASAIDLKDSYTGDHSVRVAELAVELGRAMELGKEAIREIRMAARLHDLGKIGVPDAILMKQGLLSVEERGIMQKHAEAGFSILQYAPLGERVKQTVRHTHERWDGTGYPDGLAGEAIPISARILAVVDAYEAMVGHRPYRRAVSQHEALERLQEGAGIQFDPKVVNLFVRLQSVPEPEPILHR